MQEELYHFKYISRKWNGKRWIYTYDKDRFERDTGISQLKAYKQAKRDVTDAQNRRDAAVINAGGFATYVQKGNGKSWHGYATRRLSETKQEAVRAAKDVKNAKAAADKAYKKYIGTPMSYLTHPKAAIQARINRGKAAASRVTR